MSGRMRTCGTCVLLAAGLALAFPGRAPAEMVFVLSSGSPSLDSQTRAVLERQGHTVTLGPQYTGFTGAGLAGHDVALLLASVNWNAGDMPLTGQSALRSFLSDGRGLVTGEWTLWKTGALGHFTTLASVFPVLPTTSFDFGTQITYTQRIADPILNNGLGPMFSFTADDIDGTETFFVARPGASVFYDSTGSADGAGVVGWEVESGRVLSVSTVMGSAELADPNYSQLLGNAVRWAGQGSGPPIPEPASVVLLAVGGAGFALGWSRRRGNAAAL